MSELANCEKWWNGPEFLGNDEAEWPINRVNVDQETKSMETKRNDREFPKQANDDVEERTMISLKENTHLWRLIPNRFLSWQNFIRVQAWVYRFINNCRLHERESGELKPGEMEDAETQAIKSAQQEAFPDKYTALLRQRELLKNSKLLGLKPRLDEEGQIRSEGRLRYAEFLSEDTRFAIILSPQESSDKANCQALSREREACKWN